MPSCLSATLRRFPKVHALSTSGRQMMDLFSIEGGISALPRFVLAFVEPQSDSVHPSGEVRFAHEPATEHGVG